MLTDVYEDALCMNSAGICRMKDDMAGASGEQQESRSSDGREGRGGRRERRERRERAPDGLLYAGGRWDAGDEEERRHAKR